MVIGGRSNGGYAYDTIEVLDLTNPLRVCLPPPNLPTPLYGQVVDYIDGKVMVCGGYSGEYELSCYAYDGLTWVEETSMELNMRRRYSRASRVAEEWIVTGGSSSLPEVRETYEYLSEDTWIQGENLLPSEYSSHCQVTVDSSYIFLTGGGEGRTFLIDWNTKEEQELKAFPGNHEAGISCGKVTLDDGTEEVVTVEGGESYIFSMDTLLWRPGPAFGTQSLISTVQIGNTFLAVGGDRSGQVYIFNPTTFEFENTGHRLLNQRAAAGLALVPAELVNC